MVRYIQRGYNAKYPESVVIWRLGDIVPEWLSDIAKVESIDSETSEIKLYTRPTSTGGYEILDSSGSSTLVMTYNKTDLVCKSDKIIFSLTEKQFELLYIEDH